MLPYPITGAVLFTVIGVSPLFLAGAYAVRLQDELGFVTSRFGYSVSVYFLAAAVASAWSGPVIDRLGSFIGFRLAMGGTAVSALVIALFATNWLWVAAGLGISGIANSLAQLSANQIIADSAGEKRQGFGFGAKQAAIPVGSLLAGMTVSLLGVGVPWERTFLALAAIAVVAGAIAPRFGPSPGVSKAPNTQGVGDAWPQLLLLGAAAGAAGGIANSLVVLVVDAFETDGFSESAAARVLAFGSAASVLVRLMIGWFIDRKRRRGFLEIGTLMLVGSLGFLLMAVAGASRPLLFLGVFLAFAAGWGWTGITYLVATRSTDVRPATATGFVLTGVYVGAVVGPALIGTIADEASFDTAWGVSSVVMLLGAVLVALSHRAATLRAASAH